MSFLLTDVVGSTTLWERAPVAMDAALARHDALITSAVEAHGGIVLKHKGEGDSTFCVFDSASAAAAAATDAQRRLSLEAWPDSTPIVVRMGIHSGEAFQRGRDYYGQAVNRAARVRALASGGQVLLSSVSAALVGQQLPEGTELRFIRSELLRGIDRLEAIHELLDTHRHESPSRPEDTEPMRALPPPIESALPGVFVGRERPLRQIEAARQRSLQGVVQTVLLGGEPGAGKSTIAAVAARAAHQDDWTVLFGSCDEQVTTPYEPFRDALGQYFEEAPSAVLAEHIAAHGGEVGRLTSSLSARVGALPPVDAADPETSRRLLFEGVTDLLQRAAADRPLLLVLDDIQWADQNTALLIGRLAKLRDTRLMLLATYRSTAADLGEFGALIGQLRATPGVSDVDVEGLTDGELVTLLEAAAGHPLDDEGKRVAAHLHDETDGNPFFVAELIRHFVETGVLAPDQSGTWRAQVDLATVAMPGTVRGVLQERIGRLSDEAQRALAVAAVSGRQFESPLLADVLGIDELTVVDGIESAVSVSLVRELAVGRFEFTHALVQHTLYDGLSTTRRALHHRQVALALETRARVPAAEVAMHWAASGPDNRAQIAEWARRAGDEALAALSPEDAISWFRMALDATDEDAQRLDLLIALGGAQRWADADAFRQTLLDAAALAERLGDDAALIRAALANNRGGASRAGSVDAERVAVLERALDVVGPHDSTERACLLALLALELSQGGEWERRLELADAAVSCARRIGDEVTLLRVLLHTTEATRLPATLDRRLIDTEELFDIAKRMGDPVLLGIAALREARVKIEAAAFDQLSDAVAVLDDVAELDPYVRFNRPSILAVLAHVAGDFPAALSLAEEARVAGGTEGDAAATYAATTAQVLWDMGSLGTMVPMIESTLRAHPGVTGFRGLLGVGYCEVGRFDEARSILRHEVDTDFADHPLNPLWLVTMSLFASLCIELEDAEAAEKLYPILAPWRGRANSSVVSINGLVTESLAGLAFVAGDFDRAERDIAEALEQATRVGARVSAIRTRLAQARLMAAKATTLDDTARAAAAARNVEREAGSIGMKTVERAAATLAESISSDSAPRR